MTDPWESLLVDVVDDEIIVSLSSYSVTYFKREDAAACSKEHTDGGRSSLADKTLGFPEPRLSVCQR